MPMRQGRVVSDPNASAFIKLPQRPRIWPIMQEGATMSSDSVATPSSVVLNEQHGDIDFREFESLTPEAINEIEEWNRQNPTLTIYDDDVVIEDGKVVE